MFFVHYFGIGLIYSLLLQIADAKVNDPPVVKHRITFTILGTLSWPIAILISIFTTIRLMMK